MRTTIAATGSAGFIGSAGSRALAPTGRGNPFGAEHRRDSTGFRRSTHGTGYDRAIRGNA